MVPDQIGEHKMKLNQTQEEMIREFAKSNKFSQAKLLDLGAQLLGTVKKSTGKPANPETLEIRQRVAEFLQTNRDKFTTIDLASKVGCSVLQANSALTYYKETFNINVVGKQEKEGKGKKPHLYQVCN